MTTSRLSCRPMAPGSARCSSSSSSSRRGWFNRAAFDRTHACYEKYGGITIVVARFAPFVAGYLFGAWKASRNKTIGSTAA